MTARMTRREASRLGGLATAKKPGHMQAMARKSALTRTKGDRTLPSVAEYLKTPAGRREFQRQCEMLGIQPALTRLGGAQ